jgi:hypothetical protein
MRLSASKLLMVFLPLLITACATMGPPQPPSLELPKPPTDLQAKRKGDQVILTWTIPSVTTDRKTIRAIGPTQICRGVSELKQCGTPAGETTTDMSPPPTAGDTRKPKVAASYTDAIPSGMLSADTSSAITYAVEVLNSNHRGAGISNQVQVPLIRGAAPPDGFQARVTGQGVVLSWTSSLASGNLQKGVHYLFRVYRRQEGSERATLAGEVPATSERNYTLIDSTFEWEKTYTYTAEAVTVISAQGKPDVVIEGADTPKVTVFADDVFPPAVPAGLQAVFSGPGQQRFIDLVWAPVPDLDLDGYNIYRHETGGAAVKINSELVKAPAYRDANLEPGKNYVYSVSAVDVRGNESARSEETGETVPQ